MIFGTNLGSIKLLAQETGLLSLNKFSELLEELLSKNQLNEAEDLFYWRCASDISLFAVAFFPHYCTLPFNEFHNDLFKDITFMERAIRRVRAAPRGYAKSTIAALIKPIHDVCYELEKFIVVISNTQDQANGKLRDIRSEILKNDILTEFYGINFPNKKPAEQSFVVDCGNSSCLFKAYGSGVELRGIRYGADRPTKIILDDTEHSEEVHNESLRKKDEDWYFQVVSQIGTKTTNIDFVGTVLHKESLLQKLIHNPAYTGRVYKSVINWSERQDLWKKWEDIYTDLDNPNRVSESNLYYAENEKELLKGVKVLWPEKETYLDLMKELIEKGRVAFMKEKQNQPLGGDEVLFSNFQFYREGMGEVAGQRVPGIIIERSNAFIPLSSLKEHCYGTLDPATGQTKQKKGSLGDFTCILTGYKDPLGRLLVHHDYTKRAAPSKYIAELFNLHELFDYQKFGIETNLYRNLLLPNIVSERKKIEKEKKRIIRLGFYDIENVDKKEKRIYTLEPKVSHGWILFNRALSNEFMGQMEAFPHGDHDDCPDTLEMLWGLVNGRYKAASISKDPMHGR